MSNLYGYTDYNGPNLARSRRRKSSAPTMVSSTHQQQHRRHAYEDNNKEQIDDEENDPLRPGLWMEGDSLAPPCGSSISLIYSMLEFAEISSKDVVYDLGGGDGRICLEALVRKKCQYCVSVESEDDLVEKGNRLIEELPLEYKQRATRKSSKSDDTENQEETPRIQHIQGDLRTVLRALVARAAAERDDGISREFEQLRMQNVEHDDSDPTDLSQYANLPMPTVIVLYLLPEAINEIRDDLLELLKSCRIVCIAWDLPSTGASSVKPIQMTEVHEPGNVSSTSLFLYTPECYERLAGFDYMLSCYNS